MDVTAGEVAGYWKAVVGTLHQRGLLQGRPRRGGVVLPEADAILLPDRCIFALDMQRLAGISRETWLDRQLWAQWRAALKGRRAFVSEGGGLAICVAREPGEEPKKRLPAVIPLDIEAVPPTPYQVLLGYTTRGPVALDLAETNRAVLVAGTTGGGKTNLAESVILQLVAKHVVDELQVVIVDPKQVDFGPLTPYARLPHLFAPVAYELDEAAALIGRVYGEYVRRQAVMAAAGVADWRGLAGEARLSLLLLVIDEAADLARSAAMDTLVDLARKGRAMGISLLVGTQYPTAEVISSQARVNLPTAIAFQTATAGQSRTVLGRGGAEALRQAGRALAFLDGEWCTVQTLKVERRAAEEIVGRVSPPSAPALDEVEAALVRYAVDELDGCFIIGRLYEAIRDEGSALGGLAGEMSKPKLSRLGRAWEERGWLTTPAHATDPRRVTEELLALLPPAPDGERGDRLTGLTGADRREEGLTGAVTGVLDVEGETGRGGGARAAVEMVLAGGSVDEED